MTRKDYVLIATAFAEQLSNSYQTEAARTAVKHTAVLIAEKLARDNPRFDHARFLEAARAQS